MTIIIQVKIKEVFPGETVDYILRKLEIILENFSWFEITSMKKIND